MDVIGILGGTFNPIHKGHIAIAAAAHEQFDIPRILVMPSYNPAYKEHSEIASANHRCNMIELAICDYDYMQLSVLEIERGGKTYTADTLKQLNASKESTYFIIGADSLFAILDWKRTDYICEHCHILVANRNMHDMGELDKQRRMLADMYGAVIDFIDCRDYPYSSTDIRRRIRSHMPLEGSMDERVEEYVRKNGLYLE